MKKKIIIIGAGPTGLGAAYEFAARGEKDFLVLESSSDPGGLAASYTDDKGFLWDFGGHVHFSHYPYYDEALNKVLPPEEWNLRDRNSQIWMDDRLVPYPFQNNIHRLRLSRQLKCLSGLVGALPRRMMKKPSNFGEWIDQHVGKGIGEVFMVPYNKKVWAFPPERLNTIWLGDRVAPVPIIKTTIDTILKKDAIAWGPNATFRFPKRGGTGRIWIEMAKHVGHERIRCDEAVISISEKERVVKTSTGEYSYDSLVSTIPLPVLTRLMNDGSKLTELADKLLYSTVHVVGIGIDGHPPEQFSKIGWMYFPSTEIPFYRATVFSNYSELVVPDPKKQWSLQVEMSESSWRALDSKKFPQDCVNAAIKIGFIRDPKQVVSLWYKQSKYGYPTPHVGRDEILAQIQPALESMRIFSRGRFGGWKYEVSNQDHTFMQGVEVARNILNGEKESVYRWEK